MNYQRLNKAQLIEIIQEQNEYTVELDKYIAELMQQTLKYKWEHIVKESRLFIMDAYKAVQYIYEQGCRARRAMETIRQPLLKPAE